MFQFNLLYILNIEIHNFYYKLLNFQSIRIFQNNQSKIRLAILTYILFYILKDNHYKKFI